MTLISIDSNFVDLSVAVVSDESNCAVNFQKRRSSGCHGGQMVAATKAESSFEILRT